MKCLARLEIARTSAGPPSLTWTCPTFPTPRKLTLEKYFRDDAGHGKPWLFPQLLAITKRWLAEF